MATVKDFSVEEKLVALLTLQKIDSKSDEIKTLRGELPMEVKDLEDEITGLRTRISNMDAEVSSIDEYIVKEGEGKNDAGALIKKYEKQLDNVKNNREAEALNKEIEMQELEMQLRDKRIRDAQFQQQERHAAKTRTEERISILEETAAGKRKELEKIIADTEKEEKKLAKESGVAREHVDPRMLSAYERIRNSYPNGLAVVPVMRDSCGGCFNVIPPQRQSEIRQRKKIVVCEHCGRILVDTDLHDQVKVNI
jgi:predicted  nucleic acid-binding Zn-ribbon protein